MAAVDDQLCRLVQQAIGEVAASFGFSKPGWTPRRSHGRTRFVRRFEGFGIITKIHPHWSSTKVKKLDGKKLRGRANLHDYATIRFSRFFYLTL